MGSLLYAMPLQQPLQRQSLCFGKDQAVDSPVQLWDNKSIANTKISRVHRAHTPMNYFSQHFQLAVVIRSCSRFQSNHLFSGNTAKGHPLAGLYNWHCLYLNFLIQAISLSPRDHFTDGKTAIGHHPLSSVGNIKAWIFSNDFASVHIGFVLLTLAARFNTSFMDIMVYEVFFYWC
jgi:hypothetical protein